MVVSLSHVRRGETFNMRRLSCSCGYAWNYSGGKREGTVTCPKCRSRVSLSQPLIEVSTEPIEVSESSYYKWLFQLWCEHAREGKIRFQEITDKQQLLNLQQDFVYWVKKTFNIELSLYELGL